jgi:hypothetical protein
MRTNRKTDDDRATGCGATAGPAPEFTRISSSGFRGAESVPEASACPVCAGADSPAVVSEVSVSCVAARGIDRKNTTKTARKKTENDAFVFFPTHASFTREIPAAKADAIYRRRDLNSYILADSRF